MSNKQYSTEHLIDAASMDAIRRYLEKDPTIAGIIHVKEEELAHIGDLCAGDLSDRDADVFSDMYNTGKIEFWRTSSRISIPLTNAVHCIRLEPYYLVKDLHKVFS